MRKCYVFDIDGTLANGDHRLHHIVRTDGQPKDWDAYFDACGGDAPHEHIIELASDLRDSGAVIVYVSGRNERCREATEKWLDSHGLPTKFYIPQSDQNRSLVYMRGLKDFQDDDKLKIKLLEQVRADGFDPIMAFDDRDRVVAAWRAAGIPCAQVAPGDF